MSPVTLLAGYDQSPEDRRLRVTDLRFRDLVRGREDEFPILARAVANSDPARYPRIEWLFEREEGTVVAESNYCQIVRHLFSEGVSIPQFATQFLEKVEDILRNGRREIRNTNQRFCGGVLELLGRDLEDGDVIALRPLREPALWETFADDRSTITTREIRAEFSLQIIKPRPSAVA